MSNNIIPFSKIIKYKSETDVVDLEDLTDHYGKQLILLLQNHGVNVQEDEFLLDYAFTMDFLKAALLRSYGFYHPFQDILDQMGADADEYVEEDDDDLS